MQKQPVKAANRKIWARQTPMIRTNNPRNNKDHLRKKTKRKTIKRLSSYMILKNEMILQQGSIFFIPRPQSNRPGRVKVTPKIINLSSKPLTEKQINLLRSGLKFTPTPKPNNVELKSDIQEFTRKLRLIEFFHPENLDNFQGTRESVSGPLVKNKSNFYPPRNRNKFLDTTIDFINQQNLNNLRKNKNNLSKDDWQALRIEK